MGRHRAIAQRDLRLIASSKESIPMNRTALRLTLALAIAFAGAARAAEPSEHAGHGHAHPDPAAAMSHAAPSGHATGAMSDTRQLVTLPAPMRVGTLSHMREHLMVMGRIQEALAAGAFDQASEIAEQQLGMSSLALHGAHERAKHMPPGMQAAGEAMHRSASRFALVAKDASASGDLKPPLVSLAKLNQTCVACHAAYRLQ
jgi:hypothetical protein